MKEPQLPCFFETDTARREIRHTPVLKFHARIGNIGLVREHRNANGPNFADGRRHQTQNDVEVVNHQVEDDIDIETPGRERGEPVDFEKLRAGRKFARGCNGWVESLDMAYLQDALVAFRRFD